MTTAARTTLDTLFQINMPVKDIDRAAAFYRDVLGIKFLIQRGNLAFFLLDGVRLLLEVPEEAGGRYNHPGSILYFSVTDIETAFCDLTQQGVEFIQRPEMVSQNAQHQTWMAFFSDGEWNTHAITSQVPVPS